MELLLEEHQTLVQNHIQKIDSAFHRLQTLGREHAQTLVDEADEISAEWLLEHSNKAKLYNIFEAEEILCVGRGKVKLTLQQEFDHDAALLQLKLEIAPINDIQQLLRKLESLSRILDSQDSQYKLLLLKGNIHAASGCADLAYDMYGAAAAMYSGQSGDVKYLDPFIKQQACLHTQGKNKRALDSLLPLKSMALPLPLEALLKRTLGDIYRSNANWHEAELLLTQAIALAREYGDTIHEGEWNGDLGQVYRSSGLHQKAIDLQEKAYDSAFNSGYKARLATACGYLGFTKYALIKPDHESALFYLGTRLIISESQENKYGIGWCLNNIGKVYLSLKKVESAIRFFERRLQLAKDTGDSLGEGTALGNLGSAYRNVGKYEKAIEYHKLYLENAGSRLDTGGEAIMLRELVIDCILSHQLELALQYAIQGMITNNVIRARFTQQDDILKIANHEKNQANLYGLLQFLLIKLQMYGSALIITEMARARALSDLIVSKSGIKSEFLLDLEMVVVYGKQLHESSVHRCLQHIVNLANHLQSTLVIYSVLEEPSTGVSESQTCVYIWVVPPSQQYAPRFKKTVIGRKDTKIITEDYVGGLQRDLETVSRDIRPHKNRSRMADATSKMEILYNALILPIEHYLPESRDSKVIFIPHGFLLSVPFAAFRHEGTYLIEKFAISQAPSLAVLDQLAAKHCRSPTTCSNLIVGNPTMPRPDIPKLPGAEKEARKLHSMFGGELLIGHQATKETVKAQLPKYSLVHLATHAILADSLEDDLDLEEEHLDGDYSIKGAIVLTKSSKTCSGILTSNELQALDLSSCKLFTLSCCRTACGKVTGDGVLGLSRALLVAGACCQIITHWKVHDRSTPVLMESFYSHYMQSQDAAAALRAGMLTLIADDEHVTHWGAFSVMGVSPGMINK